MDFLITNLYSFILKFTAKNGIINTKEDVMKKSIIALNLRWGGGLKHK